MARRGFQVGFVVVTLLLTLYYNIAYYWYTPLTGVRMDYINNPPSALQITQVLSGSPGDAAGLKLGDKLLTIDGQAITTLNRPFYIPKSAGETLRYTVERGGEQLTFDVVAGDYFQRPEYLLEMLPFELLSLLVYALGLLLYLFSAPQDTRTRLVGAVWLLAGLALAAGGPGYANGGWFVFDVFLVAYAAGSYFSLAAHLYFPASTFSNQDRIMILRFQLGLTLLTLTAYVCQRMFTDGDSPPEAFVSGTIIKYIFILTWFVNLGLLLKNRFAAKDTETKRQTQIILGGTLLGVTPVLLFSSLPALLLGPRFVILPGQISVFALIFIPLSYGYVIRQHKLLKIDLLVNRALAWFIVVALALVASAGMVGILSWLHGSLQIMLFGGVLAAVLTTGLRNSIQVWVDRVLYGVSYDFRSVTTQLSRSLSQTTNRRNLDEVLRVEFAQQMHIQKSALLMVWDGCIELQGQGTDLSIADDDICQLLLEACLPVRAINVWAVAGPETTERWVAFDWARIFAPIAYNGTLHGILVLGDRLTGDYYSDQDMENINTVSQLVALTAANIATVESLRGLAQRLVQTDEEQRRSVARDLHDDVLQDLSFIQSQLTELHPDLAAQQKKLATRLRQIIKAQRPSFLEQDIAMTLQGLIDNMQQLVTEEKTTLRFRNLLPEPITLGGERTTALYRIAQESLSNVLKHAQANDVLVTLKIDRGDVLEIELKDDGIGMKNPAYSLYGRYGLMGMRERAIMIGATLTITSAPDEGTIVLVRLKL